MQMTSNMKLPQHKCGLYLEHNRYKDYYETIEEAVEEVDSDEWATHNSRENSLITGELWTLQWYPDTPIGFCRVAGYTLEEVLDRANE